MRRWKGHVELYKQSGDPVQPLGGYVGRGPEFQIDADDQLRAETEIARLWKQAGGSLVDVPREQWGAVAKLDLVQRVSVELIG